MLILLVGLQAIPDDVYEAGALDGASRGQTFRYITLPLLRPSLALALILCVTGSLLAFDQFYILTKGGARQQHGHGGPGDLPRGVPEAEPRHRRGHLDHRPGRRCSCSTPSSSAACAIRAESEAMARDAPDACSAARRTTC